MEKEKIRIGIMTSGGDAPGMNAAARAVVKTAIRRGAEVYGIMNGYMGLQHPEDGGVRKLASNSASGIMNLGGTIMGTARCKEMMTAEGRRKAIQTLVTYGIDRLVCIGGDGSLTGADTLRKEWEETVKSLIEDNEVPADSLEKHPFLSVIGLPGTIDNDLCGTDITIGTDTALHRIVDALDCIFSTAASHQRTFVVEVMGRHCGYLAVMAGLATGAEWIMIPEVPCGNDWEEKMGEALANGRKAGKRAGIVIVAEGARKIDGTPITSQMVQECLSNRMHQDTRVTILGHVQRGGAPSAYDRNLSSILGYKAVEIAMQDEVASVIVGMHENRPGGVPLMEAVEKTRKAQRLCTGTAGLNGEGLDIRGVSLKKAYELFCVVNSTTNDYAPAKNRKRIGIVLCGASAPGMNMAVRTVARLAIAKGHQPVAIMGGMNGLIHGHEESAGEKYFKELSWMDVSGWAGLGGAAIGTSNVPLRNRDYFDIAITLRQQHIDALVLIGGWLGFETINSLYKERDNYYPNFNIPMICIPASIDNNLPGGEYSIGADTALNNIVSSVDKIKLSAVTNKRCFLIEVMGYKCGYLAQMAGLALGAERVYMHEIPHTTSEYLDDILTLKNEFEHEGRTLALIVNNEKSNYVYTTGVMQAMFEAEGAGTFDVRSAILGHTQQGGDPTPFDRTLAAGMAQFTVEKLMELFEANSDACGFVGLQVGGMHFTEFHDFSVLADTANRRPKTQWWRDMFKINQELV